jgi:peptidoglycan/LPS O-acetylase OafA/YrhL
VFFYALIVIIAITLLHIFTGTFGLLYTFDFGFLRGIIGFFIGVICLTVFNKCKTKFRTANNYLFSLLEVLMLALTITLVCCGEELKSYGFVYLATFFATILVFAFEKGWLSTQLKKSKFLHRTGQYSYSIYMIHTLILSLFNVVFFRALKLPPSAYGYMFIVNYAIIWIASSWTFKNIEMRFNLSTNKEPGKKGWWVW